jgi:hypothetical protein
LIVAVLAAVALAPVHAAAPVAESRLKAAFISKFPQFVVWPSAVIASHGTADICVFGPAGDLRAALSEIVSGDTLHGHGMRVREIAVGRDPSDCLVVFVGSHAEAVAILQRVADRPVLTIGDYPEFLDDGGIIELRVVDGRVRFEVSMTAAQRAGLRIGSQLLRLALNVRGVEKGKRI